MCVKPCRQVQRALRPHELIKGLRSWRSELLTSSIKRRPPCIILDTTETCTNISWARATLRLRTFLNSVPQVTRSPHPGPNLAVQIPRYVKKPAERGKDKAPKRTSLYDMVLSISPLVRKHTVAWGEPRSCRVSRDPMQSLFFALIILLYLVLISGLKAECTCSQLTETWVLCSCSSSWKWQNQVLEKNWLAPRPIIFLWTVLHLAASGTYQRPSDNHLLPQGPPIKPWVWWWHRSSLCLRVVTAPKGGHCA